MASVVINGDTSGSVTLQAPAAAGATVLTLPSTSGTIVITSGAQTIEFADGSASAPSITNSGDTNTGIFFPAADTIAFAEGGVEAMRIDSSGNVGIGTTSPSYNLDVKTASGQASIGVAGGTDRGNVNISTGAADGTGVNAGGIGFFGGASTSGSAETRLALILATTEGATANNRGGRITFHTKADNVASLTERMRITSAGNVGIGTTSPANFSGTNLQVEASSTAFASTLWVSGTYTMEALVNQNAAAMSFGSRSNHHFALVTNDTERMRIDTSGNVSIGTTAVRAATLVNALNGYTASNNSAANPYFQLYNANAGTNLKYWRVTGNSDGSYAFETVNDAYSSATERMRIDSSGNVGIGTTTTTNKLNVSGTGVTKISVANSSVSATGYMEIDNSSYFNIYTAGGMFIGPTGANPLQFQTNNTERMRITSGGKIFMGSTSAQRGSERLSISASGMDGIVVATDSAGLIVRKTSFGNSFLCLFENNSGTQVGAITSNGTNTTYTTTSDYRLKENIVPMTGALDKVALLKPVTYKWKATGEEGQGFIAHELQAVVPDCVTGEKDAVDEEGNIKPQGIDTSFLVATLTAAIQEQQTIINDLKARIETLENK